MLRLVLAALALALIIVPTDRASAAQVGAAHTSAHR